MQMGHMPFVGGHQPEVTVVTRVSQLFQSCCNAFVTTLISSTSFNTTTYASHKHIAMSQCKLLATYGWGNHLFFSDDNNYYGGGGGYLQGGSPFSQTGSPGGMRVCPFKPTREKAH